MRKLDGGGADGGAADGGRLGGPGRAAAASLALALLACGGEGAPPALPVSGSASCAVAADCEDGNACTSQGCEAGACRGAYLGNAAPVLLGAGLAGQAPAAFSLGATSGSVIPRTTHTFCPDGADPSAEPPTCVGELDLPAAAGAAFAPTADGGVVAAVVPFRFANLATLISQTAGTIGSGAIAVAGNAACAGAPQTSADLPVQVAFAIDGDGALAATAEVDAVALANAMVECLSGGVAPQVRALVAEAGRALIRARLQASLVAALEGQLCAGPPCPAGFAEAGGRCRQGGAAGAPCLARPRDPRTGLLEPVACVEASAP